MVKTNKSNPDEGKPISKKSKIPNSFNVLKMDPNNDGRITPEEVKAKEKFEKEMGLTMGYDKNVKNPVLRHKGKIIAILDGAVEAEVDEDTGGVVLEIEGQQTLSFNCKLSDSVPGDVDFNSDREFDNVPYIASENNEAMKNLIGFINTSTEIENSLKKIKQDPQNSEAYEEHIRIGFTILDRLVKSGTIPEKLKIKGDDLREKFTKKAKADDVLAATDAWK